MIKSRIQAEGGEKLEGPKISKRIRDSPSKNLKAKKQTTISNYWLAKDEAESLNSNRFSILDTNDDNDIDNEPKIKIQKPSPIFVDGVSNMQPLYEMLNYSAKNSYDI